MSAQCRQRTDYADNIYNDRRTNYWGHACARDLNGFSPSGCYSDPKKPLNYTEPRSFDAYMRQVHNIPSRVRHQGMTHEQCTACRGKNKEPSLIVPQNNAPPFCSGCEPNRRPGGRRMVTQGRTFRPASSLPVLDRYNWMEPESLYTFDNDEEYQDAYNSIWNDNTPPTLMFNFQNPEEQMRLWYGGLAPKVSKIQRNAEKCCGARRGETPKGVPPIPYNKSYIDVRYSCGCNKAQCSTCGGNTVGGVDKAESISCQLK